MADSNSSTTSTTKKPYVRVVTDKRREQNRTSQKKYRERLRKRLEELEEQVTAIQPVSKSNAAPASQASQSQRPPQPNNRVKGGDTEPPYTRPSNGSEDPSKVLLLSRASTTSRGLGDVFQAAGDIALPQSFASPAPSFQISFISAQPQLQVLEDEVDPAIGITPSPLTAADLMPKADPDSIDLRDFWPVPAGAGSTPYCTPPQSLSRPSRSLSSFSPSPADDFLGSRSVSTRSPSQMPDPYINHLQLNGEACFSASFAIAESLGISKSAYVNDHPSLFYHSTEPNFYHLPRNLRPTSAQLTLPHPVYLDCIIFPAFRTRAIIKSARGELDHYALFMDLMHDGLVCWGNSNAQTKYGKDMRDGVAWSARSWEAKCWFLEKWKGLIGTENVEKEDEVSDEDGIWETSRWWWSLRGEVMW